MKHYAGTLDLNCRHSAASVHINGRTFRQDGKPVAYIVANTKDLKGLEHGEAVIVRLEPSDQSCHIVPNETELVPASPQAP